MTTTNVTPVGTANGAPTSPTPQRLTSLDALRGFDMFWIIGADALVHALHRASEARPIRFVAGQMEHVAWEGFRFYDLIFPLFVFIVGVSLVFSLGRLIEQKGRVAAIQRVVRRAVLLYLLGIFYYGGFATPFERIRLLGVLQRIALCYLFAGLTFCWLGNRGRVVVAVSLLVGYWALMTFVPVPGVGAGGFAPGQNLANWIDQHYLPLRKWDGAYDPEGLLSTLPAIATCLLGVFAGTVLQKRGIGESQKAALFALAGVVLAAAGWAWGIQFPVIKKIWTSSYVLVAGGYSLLLLAAFHWIVEVRGWRAWAQPFVWIGMNPITIYLLNQIVDLEAVARRFVGLPSKWFGRGDELVVAIAAMAINFALCRFLYRRKIFLRF